MGKFLNETGLSYFWTKTKEYLKKKYVGIGDTINYTAKDGNTVTIGNNDGIGDGTISLQYDEDGDSATLVSTSLAYDGLLLSDWDGSTDPKKDSAITRITAEQIDMAINNGDSASLTPSKLELNATGSDPTATLNKSSLEIKKSDDYYTFMGLDLVFVTHENSSVVVSSQTIKLVTKDSNGEENEKVDINKNKVEAPKFVKTGGTANQVLLANGDVAELNAANGIPKLDANGRIPLSQLGNLDTTLFEVVSALPTTSIKKNHIYLVASTTAGANNSYIEYIYTGDVSATYDATKWEKIGEYKADVDLTPYAKKTEAIAEIQKVSPSFSNGVDLWYKLASDTDEVSHSINIANATIYKNGIMSAKDKTYLNVLLAKFPLKIENFAINSSLLEVGSADASINVLWNIGNTDVHPINMITIDWAGTAETVSSTAVGASSKTIASLSKSGTKTITLTVMGDGISDGSDAVPFVTVSKEVTITYHYPSYIGVVAKNAVIGETAIKALTKSIEWGKGKKAALTQSSQKIVYAYPAEYGDLTSIKDGNGFEGFAGYTKTTLDFTINGNKVTYNVYIQKEIATSDSTYTFA